MTSDGIFLRSGSGLSKLTDQPYDSEDVLQQALAMYPEVLAGTSTTGHREDGLLLVRREMGVPNQDGGAANFSLDHLFIDAECVPVLVEVKRSRDTRIRREVVGQMLDYAANGVRYWPLEMLQQSLEAEATALGTTSDQLLHNHRPDLDPEQFWAAVQSNLTAGRIRMLFVADALPDELCRVIEFLNEQMSPAEVLGVELRQYVGDDHIVYVPRVVGQTSTAVAVKGAAGPAWTEGTFLDAAEARCNQAELALVRRLLSDPTRHGGRLSWGKGVTPGVGGWYPINGVITSLWILNLSRESSTSDASLSFYFQPGAKKHGNEVVEKAAKLLESIPDLKPGVEQARASGWSKYASVLLRDIAGHADYERAVFEALKSVASNESS